MRRLRRAVALALALTVSILRYCRLRLHGAMDKERQALWMQAASRAVLTALQVEVRVEGKPPDRGLLVANHLSYFDIAVFSAIVPSAFVARADVERWPLFGAMSRWGATIYLDRASPASAGAAARDMALRLASPIPVVLFPEATSSSGSEVLRFHSRLFRPATELRAPITAAAISYIFDDGPQGPVAEREACFFGEDELVPHLWKVLKLPRLAVSIRFGETLFYDDPRTAAEQSRAQVMCLRAGGRLGPTASGRSLSRRCRLIY